MTYQQGDGILIRDPNIDPPQVRQILSVIGSDKVNTLKLVRTPLSKVTKLLLNIASLGTLQKKLDKLKIDDLFHLSMIINNKYKLEKNEVIRLYPDASIPQGSLTLDVPIQTEFTIREMLDETKRQMGDRYGAYDAKDNNCGIFLNNVLKANGISNNETDKFLNQPTIELFKEFPRFSEILVKLGTTAGAVGSRVIEGEGKMIGGMESVPNSEIESSASSDDNIYDITSEATMQLAIENIRQVRINLTTQLINLGGFGPQADIIRRQLDELDREEERLLNLAERQRITGGCSNCYMHNFGLHYANLRF